MAKNNTQETEPNHKIEKEMHLIAEFPSEISEYLDNGGDPEAIELDEDFVATFTHGDHVHYYILCTATLPVKQYDSTVGFGLWVEVFKGDFEKFIDAQEDDVAYASFECAGTMANDWPLFDHTLEDEVEIKVIDANLKPHIVTIDTESEELKKYIEVDSLDENAKGHLRARMEKLVE